MPDKIYCYPDSDVLKNRMGIRDREQLFARCIASGREIKIQRISHLEGMVSMPFRWLLAISVLIEKAL